MGRSNFRHSQAVQNFIPEGLKQKALKFSEFGYALVLIKIPYLKAATSDRSLPALPLPYSNDVNYSRGKNDRSLQGREAEMHGIAAGSQDIYYREVRKRFPVLP